MIYDLLTQNKACLPGYPMSTVGLVPNWLSRVVYWLDGITLSCIASYRVSCILCSCVTIDIFLAVSPGGIPQLEYVI